MHKVFIKGVRSLEDKFDKEKADWIAQRVATIRFDETPLTEAAAYDKTVGWILTEEEYKGLTQGGNWIMPERTRQALKTVAAAILDMLQDEGGDK